MNGATNQEREHPRASADEYIELLNLAGEIGRRGFTHHVVEAVIKTACRDNHYSLSQSDHIEIRTAWRSGRETRQKE